MIYVDSNYWIYWLDSRLPEHSHTIDVMRRALSTGVIMSYTTLVEVAHYLRKLPRKAFLVTMGEIQNLSTLTMVDLDHETVHLALDLLPIYSSKGLGGRDCVILATMQIHGVKDIITHDRAFAGVQGVNVMDDIPPSG